jgi:hypothetical protein
MATAQLSQAVEFLQTGAAQAMLILGWLLSLAIAYILIRLGVRHGIRDADRDREKRRPGALVETVAGTPAAIGTPIIRGRDGSPVLAAAPAGLVNYRIDGTNDQTSGAVKTYIAASSIEAARRKAKEKGITAATITPVSREPSPA